MARSSSPTLIEFAVANLRARGYGSVKATLKASQALTTVAALAIAASKGAASGSWPTQAEYAAWWRQSERSAQREWAAFREAFPTEETPDRLARHLLDVYRGRLTAGDRGNPSVVFSTPIDGLELAAAAA